MYGRMGYGGQLPFSMGEAANINNLSGVSDSGYGVYLGNIFDDLAKIAGTVGTVSGELSRVASGQAKIATFPTDRASIILPIPGSPVAQSIPLLPLAIGAAALFYFGFSGRRRRS